MTDHAICLGCGGVVDEGEGIPAGMAQCACPPPSVAARTVECPSCGGSLRVGVRACPYCHCTLATSRCPHCTAWNLSEARHCQSCGRALQGSDATGGTPTDRQCPRCGRTLLARCYGELDVDECDGCGGLLVTPTMMDRVVAARDAPANLRLALPERPAAREGTVKYVRCPTCDTTMNRQAFGRISGVVVDVCRQHGVWFDAGELAEVLAFVERGGLEEARRRDTEKLADAARAARSEHLQAVMSPALSQGGPGEGRPVLGRSTAGVEFVRALAGLWS